MMLSHPVLLGFLWSLLLSSASGQAHVSSNESTKVYSYSYHIQHNGTTNSKEILRRVLGVNPETGIETPDDKAIVKTFSSPSIRGFFTKGILPAGPVSKSYDSGFRAPVNTNNALLGIRKVVEENLQPPNTNIITGLLPPISPDISRDFPGDFNNINHIGNNYQNQDDFPKIPPPPPPINNNINNGISRVQSFARDTPDGGRIVGKEETFSYNPPPVVNSGSRYEENSEGFRRNENLLNDKQEVTGHRTQSYFRQHFRTVTPNLETNNLQPNNRIDNNNNQWWNVLNVLGDRNNFGTHQNAARLNQQINYNQNRETVPVLNNHVQNSPNSSPLNHQISNNIDQVRNHVNNQFNRAFGARLSAFNRQNGHQNRQGNFGANNINSNSFQNQNNNAPKNVAVSPQFKPSVPVNHNRPFNNQNNNAFPYPQNDVYNNNQFTEDTEKKVLNLIQDVNSQLNSLHKNAEPTLKNAGLTWDDDRNYNANNDWSFRQPRQFSNAHSGPSRNPLLSPNPIEPVNFFKSTLEALVDGRNFNKDFQVPPIAGGQGNSYDNIGGGGVEKFFGIDRIMEGPNSFSRNQQRRYERNFGVNSNSGFERSNQWSTNNVRRLDAQSSKDDFSKDFIDVFRDDY